MNELNIIQHFIKQNEDIFFMATQRGLKCSNLVKRIMRNFPIFQFGDETFTSIYEYKGLNP